MRQIYSDVQFCMTVYYRNDLCTPGMIFKVAGARGVLLSNKDLPGVKKVEMKGQGSNLHPSGCQ
jgi:hypothetical protein